MFLVSTKQRSSLKGTRSSNRTDFVLSSRERDVSQREEKRNRTNCHGGGLTNFERREVGRPDPTVTNDRQEGEFIESLTRGVGRGGESEERPRVIET